jgi:hypothetical protein
MNSTGLDQIIWISGPAKGHVAQMLAQATFLQEFAERIAAMQSNEMKGPFASAAPDAPQTLAKRRRSWSGRG